MPEFIGERFYSKTARLVAVLCLIVVSVTYVIGQMKGVGVAFSRFLETDYSTGLFIGMAIVFFYAVLGGMKGITYTQIAQYVVLIFAFTVPAIFISLELTGNPIPQLGLIGDYKDGTPLLQKLDTVITELGFDQYTQSGMGSKLNMFAFTLSLMIGTAGLPHVIIRFFTVKKVSDARLSAGWALVFIAILYTTAPAVAAMARLNFVKTVQVDKVGVDSGNIEYAKRPEWFKNWEKTGLLKHEDKNGDGRIQYYNDKDSDLSEQFSTYGWKGNEMVTVDKDIIVLANPEIADLPDWVIALVVAGGLAAALSTAAGLLLAISSSISHDLLKGIIMPNITDRQELNAGRLSMIGAIALAGYLGLNPPDFAAGTVAMAFGLAASSIFPVLIMGIFMKKINREGAIAGMVAGLLVTLLYVFQHKGIMFIPGTSFLGDSDENWFFGIEPKAIGAFGALVNFVVAYVVSKMTKETPKEVQELVDDIRLPNVEEV